MGKLRQCLPHAGPLAQRAGADPEPLATVIAEGAEPQRLCVPQPRPMVRARKRGAREG
jgi:hypothetical protein